MASRSTALLGSPSTSPKEDAQLPRKAAAVTRGKAALSDVRDEEGHPQPQQWCKVQGRGSRRDLKAPLGTDPFFPHLADRADRGRKGKKGTSLSPALHPAGQPGHQTYC